MKPTFSRNISLRLVLVSRTYIRLGFPNDLFLCGHPIGIVNVYILSPEHATCVTRGPDFSKPVLWTRVTNNTQYLSPHIVH